MPYTPVHASRRPSAPPKNRPRPEAPRLRVLLAEADRAVRSAWRAIFAARCPWAAVSFAGDAEAASAALLAERPHLFVASLRLPEGLPANPQGGLRVILEAASLGVPAVLVSGLLPEPLERRLAGLGVACVRREAGQRALLTAAERALPALAGHWRGRAFRRRSRGPRSTRALPPPAA